VIPVSPRARRFRDRSGDPLDGLVNLFDVGVVLAVAFLLAALSSPALTRRLTQGTSPAVPVRSGQTVRSVPPGLTPASGYGSPVGRVYRQPDGRLIYVVPSSVAPGPGSTGPAPATPSPTR
jgi:hypothetical protein